MSVVVVLDDELLAKVARALAEMGGAHPRSIAAAVRPEFFHAVVEETARVLNTDFPDFECALIAAVSRVKEKIAPGYFYPRRSRSKPDSQINLFPKKRP